MSFTFPRDAIFLIAGPCVLESDALNLRVGEHLARSSPSVCPAGSCTRPASTRPIARTPGAARGPGLDEGLAALERVRRATGLPLLTDVHLPEQCAPAAEVVDVLQIPAFLCRQTDLLVAAGATGKPVNIKKGQWMHPEGMNGAVEKVRGAQRSGNGEGGGGTAAVLPSSVPVPASRIPRSPGCGDRTRLVLRLRRSRRRHARLHPHARGVQGTGRLRRHAQRPATGHG